MSSTYLLYGLPIESDLSLHSPKLRQKDRPQIKIALVSRLPLSGFTAPKNDPKKIFYLPLANQSVYIRFFGGYECLVSKDGKKIFVKKLRGASKLALPFQNFLRSNVLSFSLLKLGIESLHGSAILVDGKAVAFIGESGYGKSTLAGAFLKAGFPVLTDDLLVIQRRSRTFFTSPGICHLKLYPKTAAKILPKHIQPSPLGPGFQKNIYRLPGFSNPNRAYPLKTVYALEPRLRSDARSKDIRIRKLKHREAVMNVIRAAHNLVIQDKKRVTRQFHFANRFTQKISVRSVSYPFDLRRMKSLRTALLRDMGK